jgi:hypothetical protein
MPLWTEMESLGQDEAPRTSLQAKMKAIACFLCHPNINQMLPMSINAPKPKENLQKQIAI